jgi:chromosome segregation ATPase
MTREQAYLTIVEGWLRDNRGIVFTEGAVDDLCDRVAVEAERLEAENERLHNTLQLHAGDCQSLDNDIEILRKELHTERYTREQHERTIKELCDEAERLAAYNKIAHTEIDQMIVERSALKSKLERMQVALNEARGPDGHTHERVAEWLRGKGYTVTKNEEPELRYFGEIPL